MNTELTSLNTGICSINEPPQRIEVYAGEVTGCVCGGRGGNGGGMGGGGFGREDAAKEMMIWAK